ncbi:hypothetical protein VB735_16480 [Halotia wernerae UHCC 0503]|nr:hypothetical protein [Halotia wernerae UHCC 0503]
MSRPFEIEIAESGKELKKRLQTANLGNQQEIGKRLARDTSTVTRWLQKYREELATTKF